MYIDKYMMLLLQENLVHHIHKFCLQDKIRKYMYKSYLSRHMAKPSICPGENKGADQLRSNCEADQRLCFRYSDSTVPLLFKSEISTFKLFCVTVQVGLCRTQLVGNHIVGFSTRRLTGIIYFLFPASLFTSSCN